MNLAKLENASFLTFITETNSTIRGISLNINDDDFDELVHEGIICSIYEAIKEKEDDCNSYGMARSIAKDYKENNSYTVITSEHLENGCWPHYPVVLGITFKAKKLEEQVKDYCKKHSSYFLSKEDEKLDQKLLIAVMNAAIKVNKGIGYRFVERVNMKNQAFNSIYATIQVD